MAKFFIFALILTLSACNHNSSLAIKNEIISCNDSTTLFRDWKIIQYNIGDYINPKPLSSQIYENDSKEEYIIMDDNKLYCCTHDSASHIFDISKCGNLNNYSGFLYSHDTIFVYNYKEKMLYMLDSDCNIKKNWILKSSHESNQYKVDAEAIVSSPIIFNYPYVYLSGSRLGQIPLNKREDLSLSCRINIENGEIIYGGMYPEQYSMADFGGVYFNQIYHTYVETEENLVLSFPADHHIYIYSKDLKMIKKYYMGSRYSNSINSSSYNTLEVFKDKELRIEYFISQNSYGNILYDKYRDVFYRIAKHPLTKWDGKTFIKPFSIIVMNRNGKLISETPILKDYATLNLGNIHVTEKGLLIQKMSKNENVIEFVNYVYEDESE